MHVSTNRNAAVPDAAVCRATTRSAMSHNDLPSAGASRPAQVLYTEYVSVVRAGYVVAEAGECTPPAPSRSASAAANASSNATQRFGAWAIGIAGHQLPTQGRPAWAQVEPSALLREHGHNTNQRNHNTDQHGHSTNHSNLPPLRGALRFQACETTFPSWTPLVVGAALPPSSQAATPLCLINQRQRGVGASTPRLYARCRICGAFPLAWLRKLILLMASSSSPAPMPLCWLLHLHPRVNLSRAISSPCLQSSCNPNTPLQADAESKVRAQQKGGGPTTSTSFKLDLVLPLIISANQVTSLNHVLARSLKQLFLRGWLSFLPWALASSHVTTRNYAPLSVTLLTPLSLQQAHLALSAPISGGAVKGPSSPHLLVEGVSTADKVRPSPLLTALRSAADGVACALPRG